MNPGDLVSHISIPERVYMYVGPEINQDDPMRYRYTQYRLNMVHVVALGDPTFRKLRFHQSYLSKVQQ
jgi:hypothetical protein